MGTFHSIFARILRIEAERLGYTRTFSIYDTDDSQSLIKGIMNDLGVSRAAVPALRASAAASALPKTLWCRPETIAIPTGDRGGQLLKRCGARQQHEKASHD